MTPVESTPPTTTEPPVAPASQGSPRESTTSSVFSVVGVVLKTTFYFVCVVAVLAGLGTLFGLYRVDTILSGSMRPTFSEGSLTFATRTPADDLRSGMVITFVPPSPHEQVSLTHRILTVEKDPTTGKPVVTTKGDNNPSPDPWKAVVSSDSVWTVKAAVPMLGYPANWAKSNLGAILFLGGALIALSTAFDVLRERRKQEAAGTSPSATWSTLSTSNRIVLGVSIALGLGLLLMGVYNLATGKGPSITSSVREFFDSKGKNGNDQASGKGVISGTPTTSATPSPTVSYPPIYSTKIQEVPLPMGAEAVLASAPGAVSSRAQTEFLVKPSTTFTRLSVNTATNLTDTTIRICENPWMAVRGQAACPGTNVTILAGPKAANSPVSYVLPSSMFATDGNLHVVVDSGPVDAPKGTKVTFSAKP